MNLSNCPNLSAYFRKQVLNKYSEHNGDVKFAVTLVDTFLEKYPCYPEALLFKARMFISLGKDKEALRLLRTVEKLDEWKREYLFDQAEILFKIGKKSESIKTLESAVELSIRDVIEGIDNYLRGIDFVTEQMKPVQKILKKEMIEYISQKNKRLDFVKIKDILKEHNIL